MPSLYVRHARDEIRTEFRLGVGGKNSVFNHQQDLEQERHHSSTTTKIAVRIVAKRELLIPKNPDSGSRLQSGQGTQLTVGAKS
jgi:hypothetical protein